LKTLFYLLTFLVFYTYLGYFAALCAWSLLVRNPSPPEAGFLFEPFVSVVIAVRDEAPRIEKRLLNILAQDYPAETMEIVVVSDGSGDATEKLVQNLMERQIQKEGHSPVRLISVGKPRGKAHAINVGVGAAAGEIVVFADARQSFAPDAVTELVRAFRSEDVGCVSGELVFEQTPGSGIGREMGVYWKFEMKLRRLESLTGSLVGVSGAIYAVRRSLFRPIPGRTLLDDVLIPLTIRGENFRVIFQGDAKAFDSPSQDIAEEKRRKIRTLAGNWQLLAMNPGLLVPFHNPLFFKFVSHKVLRLLVPYALVGICVCSVSFSPPVCLAVLATVALSSTAVLADPFLARGNALHKAAAALRAFWFLNYFAFLAPFFLLRRKRLWR
jgi:cellulose synthase/poly-beta-1,6-N-acetylglucosamine synthase-like glycosyltransferase